MSGTIQLTEEILFDYISLLPTNEVSKIYNGSDILNSLSYDAEQDIKDRVWELLKEELNYKNIIISLHNWLKNQSYNEIEEEEESEEQQESDEETKTD